MIGASECAFATRFSKRFLDRYQLAADRLFIVRYLCLFLDERCVAHYELLHLTLGSVLIERLPVSHFTHFTRSALRPLDGCAGVRERCANLFLFG
jgi:hypothetical protein